MQDLNFPKYHFSLKRELEKEYIFDSIRKKWVVLTPEEWVRQHVIAYLVQTERLPASLIAVERMIKYNKLVKRFDVLLYNTLGKPAMLIECKAPEVNLSKETLFQIATYNTVFKVPYLFITNGIMHQVYAWDESGKYLALDAFPTEILHH
ncbi:MAG: type I restriction enzyme HsdR N-terminal domain-containing protein [Bacteroidota bacterium]|jgi:type I site-specific restriction endonuclease|nr:type I restriction enzyme HsdR N-terminal domain-containing protein [Bacteroidota bacterium]